MLSVLASSVVDRDFEPWSGKTKDYEIDICCFSTKHVALRSKSKDWFAWNHGNMSEWNDMSTRGLLFQQTSSRKIQFKCAGLVQSEHHCHLVKCNLFLA